MSKEHNALAELAKWFGEMEERELPAYGYEKDLLCINYGKAKRILEELAKLKVSSQLIGMLPKFHTIAEEGVSNGK